MRLATLKTQYGTTTVLVDSDYTGVGLGHEDVCALLRSGDWRKAAQLSGEPIVFDHEDLAPVIPQPEKIICVASTTPATSGRWGARPQASPRCS